MLPGMTSHGRVAWYELLTSDPQGAAFALVTPPKG
jgi:hypothetical protein